MSDFNAARLGTLASFLVGATAGIFAVFNDLAELSAYELHRPSTTNTLFVGALVGGLSLGGFSVLFRAGMRRLGQSPTASSEAWQASTSCVLLLESLGSTGLRLPGALLEALLLVAFLVANVAVALLAYPRLRQKVVPTTGWIGVLFFISGIAALIYQVTWQRALYTGFGSNIESVTLIVTLFMVGLGCGSFVGAALLRRFPNAHVRLFLFCESAIGIFGVVSLPLIRGTATLTSSRGPIVVSLSLTALLLTPTILMGATLPILVEYVSARLKTVGGAVGWLYFVNTLGSAAACFLTAEVLFVVGGEQAAVLVAAAANLTVAALVLSLARTVELDARQATTP